MALLEINATEEKDIKDKISKEPLWRVKQYKNIWYVVQRHNRDKHLCGYIGLPHEIILPMHIDQGGEYNERLHSPYTGKYQLDMIDVHGGVTYHGNPTGFYPNSDVSLDWIGFDTAHTGDWPCDSKPSTYKTFEYLENECQRVIEQFYKQLEDQIDCEYKDKKHAFKNLK